MKHPNSIPELIGKRVHKRHGFGAELKKQTRIKIQCAIMKETGRDTGRFKSYSFLCHLSLGFWMQRYPEIKLTQSFNINVNNKYKSP